MTKSSGIEQQEQVLDVVLNDGIDYRDYELRLLLQGHRPGHLCGSDLTARERRFFKRFREKRYRLIDVIECLYGVVTKGHFSEDRISRVWTKPCGTPVRFIALNTFADKWGIDHSGERFLTAQARVRAAWSILAPRLKVDFRKTFLFARDADLAGDLALCALCCMTFEDATDEFSESWGNADISFHDRLELFEVYDAAYSAAVDFMEARKAVSMCLREMVNAA